MPASSLTYWALRALLWVNLCCALPAQAQILLHIEFTENLPAQGRTYTTQDLSVTTRSLQVQSGETVHLAQASGNSYTLQGAPIGWTQVQQVATDTDAISVTASLLEQTVTLDISVARKRGEKHFSYSSIISGRPGQWLQIISPRQPVSAHQRSYSTASVGSADSDFPTGLYARVTLSKH